MKKTNLNIGERIYVLGLLNQYKGNHRTLALVLQDIVPVGISNEEKEEIEMKDVKNEDGQIVSIQWDSVKAKDKELELHDEVVDYLKKVIEDKSKAGEFTIADRQVITLLEKLN